MSQAKLTAAKNAVQAYDDASSKIRNNEDATLGDAYAVQKREYEAKKACIAYVRSLCADAQPPAAGVAALYFAHDGDNTEEFATLDEAKAAAESALEYYADEAAEGWDDNSLNIIYGIVLGKVQITESRDSMPDDACYPDCAGYEKRELVSFPFTLTAALTAALGDKP